MLVVALAVLLAVFGSAIAAPVESNAATVALFVMLPLPPDGIATDRLTVALLPALSAPRLQERTPPEGAHTPWVVVTAENAAGRVSLSVTWKALSGPLLVTVMT